MPPASTILMIRPVCFGFNEQTAQSNAFQLADAHDAEVQEKALAEFDDFAALLRNAGLDVMVIEDDLESHTPDSIFPNNWISLQEDGSIYLFPMEAPNRRLERRSEVLEALQERFFVNEIVDLSFFEQQNKFLEGTGSMILDNKNKLVYACISSRTDPDVLNYYCTVSGYKPIIFHASDLGNMPIYHTNVMMCVGEKFAVICLDAIKNLDEKNTVLQSLTHTGREIVPISMDQMYQFAGNMLELRSKTGENLLIMSRRAFNSLNNKQVLTLEQHSNILSSSLATIENCGGGSARCMIAEVYLPIK